MKSRREKETTKHGRDEEDSEGENQTRLEKTKGERGKNSTKLEKTQTNKN